MPMTEEGRAKISAAQKARHRRLKREKKTGLAIGELENNNEFEAAAKILEALLPLTETQRTQVIKAAAVLTGLEL